MIFRLGLFFGLVRPYLPNSSSRPLALWLLVLPVWPCDILLLSVDHSCVNRQCLRTPDFQFRLPFTTYRFSRCCYILGPSGDKESPGHSKTQEAVLCSPQRVTRVVSLFECLSCAHDHVGVRVRRPRGPRNRAWKDVGIGTIACAATTRRTPTHGILRSEPCTDCTYRRFRTRGE